mmetsp:Transcript_13016/g.22357  ORF Transcript_13016/g.22357 Transcript_13016/m.22357 type:complete len:186 (-) Transcript_13016:1319-1876(-)
MECYDTNPDWYTLVDDLMVSIPEQVYDLPMTTWFKSDTQRANTEVQEGQEDEVSAAANTLVVQNGDTGRVMSPASTSLSNSSSSLCASYQCDFQLSDLKGTTAYAARQMTPDEKQLMLLKRKIRNRESAKRSKAKRDTQIQNIQKSHTMLLAEVEQLRKQIVQLTAENDVIRKENDFFRNSFLVR